MTYKSYVTTAFPVLLNCQSIYLPMYTSLYVRLYIFTHVSTYPSIWMFTRPLKVSISKTEHLALPQNFIKEFLKSVSTNYILQIPQVKHLEAS